MRQTRNAAILEACQQPTSSCLYPELSLTDGLTRAELAICKAARLEAASRYYDSTPTATLRGASEAEQAAYDETRALLISERFAPGETGLSLFYANELARQVSYGDALDQIEAERLADERDDAYDSFHVIEDEDDGPGVE